MESFPEVVIFLNDFLMVLLTDRLDQGCWLVCGFLTKVQLTCLYLHREALPLTFTVTQAQQMLLYPPFPAESQGWFRGPQQKAPLFRNHPALVTDCQGAFAQPS